MVFAYVYFTRIIVYLVRATMPCKYGCVSEDVEETDLGTNSPCRANTGIYCKRLS
jgi:hypothetical protein